MDGTGVRDYIHVMDLAVGHVAAIKKMFKEEFSGVRTYNLGTGKGENFICPSEEKSLSKLQSFLRSLSS